MPQLDLTLKPAQMEFVTKPGSTIIQAYTLTNNTSQSLIVNTSVKTWLPTGNDGLVTYDQIPSNPYFQFSLNNADLTLGQSFLLKSNESKQLVLKIKTATDSPLADGYFTFFVNQDPSTLQSDSSFHSSALGQIGSHLLISTSDTENIPAQAKINQLTATPRYVDVFFPQINLSADIQNLTSHFFKLNGQLTVTKNNLNITQTDLPPLNVLADHNRQFITSLHPPYWPGAYTVSLKLDPNLTKQVVSTTFYVLPLSPLLGLALAGLIFWLLRRKK